MKAAVIHKPGGPENLILEELPIPVPRKDQVLVRVRSFGLNRSELMTRKGYSPDVTFPRILGIECVGEIESDPSEQFRKGQKVLAFMGEMGRAYDGSYAEFTVLPQSIVCPIESTLPWEVLGAIPEMYQTVHGSLYHALDIKKGEKLLVRGGTSSVGLLAIQVASKNGLEVLASTRNPDSVKLLEGIGASRVLIDDGTLSNQIRYLYSDGIDKVLELVGTATLKDSLQCARRGGIVCMTGMLSETWSINDFAPMEFIPAVVRLTVYDSGQVRSAPHVFQDFINQVENGTFKLKLGKVFSLDQIIEAHELMESNLARGKIVVVN